MSKEICGECKWHTYEEIDRGYVCTNADSPYCTDWRVIKHDYCPKCGTKIDREGVGDE